MKVLFSNLLFSVHRIRAGGFAVFSALLMLSVIWPHPAMAQAFTLSDIMCNAADNIGPFAPLISALAFIAGGILIGSGLMSLKEHSDNPSNTPLHRGIARLVAGSCLMTIPFIANNLVTTLWGTPTPGGGTACIGGDVPIPTASGVAGLDVLVTNLVGNITMPMISLISVAAYIMGILFILIGLLKGAKYGTDPRASSTPHILGYLVVGTLLIVAGESAGNVLFSLFGIGTSDFIDYATNATRVMSWTSVAAFGPAATKFATVVAACLTFFQLIGILAFVRGLYIVKNAVEGQGQATMAQGFTHVIGGVLAINVYTLLEVIDVTFGTNLLV